MITRTLATLALFASTLPSVAQDAGDPTFNGLVGEADCQVRIITTCQANSCTQVLKGCQGALCGALTLYMTRRQFRIDSSTDIPLQITGVAPAEVGKELWVKFLLPLKAGQSEGRLTLMPNSFGAYTGSAVVLLPGANSDPTGRTFTLVDYDCQQFPAEP